MVVDHAGEGVRTIPPDDYHAHPALSSSGARKLLPPHCPARFRWEQLHGRPEKAAFDFGSAAHNLVLGEGPDLVIVDAADWRTKAAREQRDAAHAAGAAPVLTAQYEQAKAMAAALVEHPVARALFDPAHGMAEASLFWDDERTGVPLRARLDWLPTPHDGRLIVPDYKTCGSADPDACAKAMHTYGYHFQAAWYLAGIRALDLADDAAFVFVFQEKTPPYLTVVAEPDRTALEVGRARMRQAIDVWRWCVEHDEWPGYSDDVELLRLPPWAEARHLQEASL